MKKTLIPCLLALALALPVAAGISWATKTVAEKPATEEATQAEATTVYLSDMDITKGTCGDGRTPKKNKSTDNNALTIRGTVYDNGVGVHAESKIIVKLNGAGGFQALVGIDDEAALTADGTGYKPNEGIVDFAVIGVKEDKSQTTLQSGTADRRDAEPKSIDLSGLTDYRYLILETTNGADGKNWSDHVDWVNARFSTEGEEAPITVTEAEMNAGKEKVKILPPTAPDKEGMGELDLLTSLAGFDNVSTGWSGHPAQIDASIDGNPLTLKDTVYASGVGAHATSQMVIQLNGASWFTARLGIDDEVTAGGQCTYTIVGKGGKPEETLAEGTISMNDPESVGIDVNCNGFKYLIITADANGSNEGDHVDWCNAYFQRSGYNDAAPVIVPAGVLDAKLTCATTVFSQPGVRFMHKLKAANPDAVLSVEGLPAGLTYNAGRQLVEGIVEAEGEYTYTVKIHAEGEEDVEEPVSLTVSSTLQQPVPFMGWLSWNVFERAVSEESVLGVADAFIELGLDKAGYNYICLDDFWHSPQGRAADGKPRYDESKFPNGLNYLTNEIHKRNMKIGIYSDAANMTCGRCFGSYGYEAIDAKQYADWGFDLLKYDACFIDNPTKEETSKRYKAMGDALKNCGRDILFYMCEWGIRDPWLWGSEVGGTCWRISYDSRENWDAGRHDGSNCGAIQGIDIMKQIGHYAGVNRYNDGDMMMVGVWRTGKSSSGFGANGMTATEYRSQFSMWCMFASPLTICNDVRFWTDDAWLEQQVTDAAKKKDIRDHKQFDLETLTNEEMIAIDQDRMGQAALLMKTEQDGDIEIYMKDLENGDIALAVLNRGAASHDVAIDLTEYYLKAGTKYYVRDLWAHDYVETTGDGFSTTVKSHETKVYRISEKDPSDGISAPASKAETSLRVKAEAGSVQVTAPGTAGQSKRILVSTLSGQVVATATSADETVSLPISTPKGVYIVNCVCNGRATNAKVKF